MVKRYHDSRFEIVRYVPRDQSVILDSLVRFCLPIMSTQSLDEQPASSKVPLDVGLGPHFISTRRIFAFVIAIGLFTLAARDLSDSDFWWHLRTGQLILETRTVPHVDPFSYTRGGQPWIAHEWLSELIFYLLFRMAGEGALVCIFAIIITAAFLFAYRRRACNAYVAGIVTICGALASVPTWGVRPQAFSLLLTSLFLVLLDYSEKKPRFLWWLPPLMLLWANLHGGFAIGIVLIATYLIASTWDSSRRRTPDVSARVRHLAAALLACLAIIAINPNGVLLYAYPIKTLRLRALQHISEWHSPDFHHVAFLLFFSLLIGTFISVAVSKRKIRAHELLLLVGTGIAGVHTIRHIPIFALVAIPILSRRIEDALVDQFWAQSFFIPKSNPSFTLRALNTVILLLVLTFAGLHVHRTIRKLDTNEARDFPAAAVSFLTTRQVPTPLFNHYDWGGYLIWRLYPKYRVWVDGRTDLYGDAFLQEFLQVYWAQEGWKQRLDNAGIQSALLPPTSPLARSLLASPEWEQMYRDSQAVIFIKRAAFN